MTSSNTHIHSVWSVAAPVLSPAQFENRRRYLVKHGWKFHSPTGFYWIVREKNKYRSHESIIAMFDKSDFLFVAHTPEKSGCASVPIY